LIRRNEGKCHLSTDQRHFQVERSLRSDKETESSRRKLQIEAREYQQIRIASRLLDIEISIDRNEHRLRLNVVNITIISSNDNLSGLSRTRNVCHDSTIIIFGNDASAENAYFHTARSELFHNTRVKAYGANECEEFSGKNIPP